MEMDFASMKRRELQALCKRHGLSAGGSNADLVARLSSTLSGGAAGEKMVGVVVGKGCLKRSGGGNWGAGAAKTVTFVLGEEEEAEAEMVTRGRGRRGRRPRVTWSPVATKAKGRRKAGDMPTAAEAAGDEGVAGEPGVDAPRRRSRRNVANLSDADGAASRTNSVNPEDDGLEVGEAVERKRKRKQMTRDVPQEITVSVQDEVSGRRTRSSGVLTTVTAVQSPVVEKKRGRRGKGDVKEQICLEAQGQPAENQNEGKTLRSGSLMEDPTVEKAAKVNVSGRTTRSSSVAAAMALPVVLENKRKKKEHVHLDVELPFVPVVQANVAPNTRSLRNRTVQVNDSVMGMGETHIGNKLEIRRQSCQSSTQHQQLASFVGEEDVQTVPAPSMVPELRRSRRQQSVANELLSINSNSESNNLSRALTDAKGLETAQPLMHNAAKTSMKDVVVREDENAGWTKRNTGRGRDKIAKNIGKVSVSESSGEALLTEMQLEVIEPLRRSRRKSVVSTLLEEGTKGMHGSVRGDNLEKQPREKIPVRRSTRKSVVSAVLEKESNKLTTEMMPEAHIRRSKRKSFLPNMPNDENMDHCEMVRNEELKNSNGKNAGKKLALKESARRSRRTSVVPGMLDRATKGLTAEVNSEVHVRGSMRKSVFPDLLSDENMDPCEMVRNLELKSSMGKDAGEKLATKEPSKQSTRKSVVSTLEKGTMGLPAEMNPEVHVRRSTRKSVVPNMLNNENKYQDESVRSVVGVASVKQLEANKPVRSNEGGLKLGKRRRTSMEMPRSSSNNAEVSDRQKSRRQQKAQTPASKARPAKKNRTDALQEIISFKEPNADDMVIRESTQDRDEGSHEYCNASSASIQDVNKDNATIEELSLAPLLVRLPTETHRGQWVNVEVYGSDSGDADKQGENPEFCHLVATGRTHQCEEVQEYADFRTESIHLSGISSEVLGQSSSIAELVLHAGISSENKALLDDAEADLGATIKQTLNADSNEEALGALNNPSAIAVELRSATALPHLEAEARTYEDVNCNGVESSIDIQDVAITLPDRLIGALTKLPIVDELLPCTSDALVIVNDSHACNVANWTAVKGTEDIQNVDIALSDDGLESFKSMTVAEEVQSCTTATALEDGTPADGDFERTCMKNGGASLSLVDSGSPGNQTDRRSFKSLEFKLNHLPTVNDETRRQSNEGGVTEVASQQFDDITVTVTEHDFSCQNDTVDVRIYTNTFGDQQPCSDKINSDDFSFLSGRSELEPLDIVPVDCSADDNEEQYSVRTVTEENRVNRGNSSESTKKSLSDTVLSGLHTQDCRAPGQLVDILAKETREAFGSDVYSHHSSDGYVEADKFLGVHSDAAAEKSNQGDDLCKYLSTVKVENPLATNLHGEGAAEDKSMLPIPINAEWGSSDGRHSSFGLKSLFAEEGNRRRCLIDDQNIDVKVDSGNKWSDGRHSSFGLKSLFAEESNQCRYLIDDKNIAVKVDSGNKSSDGRLSSFGLKSLFAEEGNQQCYLIDDENIAVKVDSGNKKSDGRHSSFGLNSLFAEEGNPRHYLIDNEHTAVKVDSGNKLSDGRHSSFGLKSLFAEEGNQRHYLIDDEHTAVKVDSGKKSSDGRHSSFGLKSLFAEEGNQRRYFIDDENSTVKVDSGNKSSDGRHSSFGLKSLFAEEGNQQRYLIDDENIAVKVDSGNKSSDRRHSLFGQKSLFAEEGNQRRYCWKGSSTAEQSSSSPLFMSLQESTEETMQYSSLAFAVHSKNRVDETNECHMEYNDDQTPVPEQVADHGTDVDSVLVTKNGESNENEESPKASCEEQAESGQLCLFKAANCMEVTTCVEVAYEDEENCGHVESTDINMPCEKSDDNGPSKDAKGNSDALLSSSVIAPANDNDELHLSGNITQQESTDCLDEPTLFFNVGVHQGPNEKCNKHKEDQVPSGVCTSDVFGPATANGLESGLTSLPANESSNLQDDQFNSELESTQVVQSGISCAKNSTNILEFSFTVNAVDKGTPSDPSLPKDYPMDHYQQHELLDEIRAEKSLEASAMCLENSVLRTGAEKPVINLASPDPKLQGALSEYSLKNDAETPNPKHSPFGLPSLFSEENMDGSRPHDVVAFPCAENKVDESNVSHVKCGVEKTVSSEHGLCEGSHDSLGNVKEIGSCISSCQPGNEQEESLEVSHEKGYVASVELDLADDVNQTEREITSSEVVCGKEEKMEVMSSDIDTPVRESHASELAAHVSAVSKTEICDSLSSPICGEVNPSSNPSELESSDVFHQDREVLCREHNEDQDLPGSSGFSEAVSFKFPENETISPEAAGMSVLLYEKLNPKPECDELEEHNLIRVKDAENSDDAEFVKYSIFRFPAGCQIDSCQEIVLPNDQSASKAREESTFFESVRVVGTCDTSEQRCLLEISAKLPRLNAEMLHQDHKEENNAHKDDEVTRCIPAIDMSGAAPTEGSDGGTMLLPDAELSAFADVQLKSKVENNGELNISCDKDTRSIFYNRSVDACYHEQELLNDLSSPKYLEETTFSRDGSVHGQAIPEDMPGPKSPEDYQDDSVSGSVAEHGSGGSRIRSCCFLRSSSPADLYNEKQATPCMPASDMIEPAPTERTEQGTSLLSASETSVFKDEQLNNPNLVSVGGHSHSCDEDTSNMFFIEPVESTNQREQEVANDVSSLISLKESAIDQEDTVHTKSCPGQPLPDDISAPKSPEEPTIHQDDSVPGSAVICQTSGRRRIDEISTKLLSFKISSSIKPNHIAMNTPSTRQVDNLSQSAIALLRNRENTPAIKTDCSVKLNPDRSVAKNSSRRPLQPISRRPVGH